MSRALGAWRRRYALGAGPPWVGQGALCHSLYMSLSLSVSLSLSLSVYLCLFLSLGLAKALTDKVGATYYTPEIAGVKFHQKMPLRLHWRILVKIHRTSDNPLDNAADN